MDEQLDTVRIEDESPDTNQKDSSTGNPGWRTLIIGIGALLIGLVLGYLGRGMYGPEATAARGTATANAVVVQTRSAANQEVMKTIIAQTNHFKGDPNAPVTLIEFSDFQ